VCRNRSIGFFESTCFIKEIEMDRYPQTTSNITANFNGSINGGQFAIGNGNTQIAVMAPPSRTSPPDLESLRQELAALKQRISAEAPGDRMDKALEKVIELEEAVTAEEPDLSTMEYVRGWFGKHLPNLAGAVHGVIMNPTVGRLVETAGDALANEFRRRFGTA
jgi:hypothetical protein